MKTDWTKERIQRLLSFSDVALERAILLVYANQTQDEKYSGNTKHENGTGFNGTDAQFLSSLAKYIDGFRRPEGFRMSIKQREAARPLIMKYWRQVQDVIILNMAVHPVSGTVCAIKNTVDPGDRQGAFRND